VQGATWGREQRRAWAIETERQGKGRSMTSISLGGHHHRLSPTTREMKRIMHDSRLLSLISLAARPFPVAGFYNHLLWNLFRRTLISSWNEACDGDSTGRATENRIRPLLFVGLIFTVFSRFYISADEEKIFFEMVSPFRVLLPHIGTGMRQLRRQFGITWAIRIFVTLNLTKTMKSDDRLRIIYSV